MKGVRISVLATSLLLLAAGAMARPDARKAHAQAHAAARQGTTALPRFESIPSPFELPADSLPQADSISRYETLSDRDFEIVASQLGVEVAAIKAVVVIEAGTQMQGFWAPGVPVVNFDRSMFNRFRTKGAPIKNKELLTVPKGLKGYPLSEWTQLINARKKSGSGADMGTFWGMFQIGGFNYRSCGCETVEEFVRRMSDSEFEQLELFAVFINKSGMVADLRNKNWAGFARKYNGPSYAKRGYHTKMANAYAKYKKQNK
ncbi:MAG: N-acetylmuramidase family protein [Bacteroides sp.]|nr:N-acetylmuramidase family protein [Bacteroides sp.]MBD5306908.1 N-acetylmuramidase family protein [Bacteroides sp.]